MSNVNLFCYCGHKEDEHLILKCDICECEKYTTIGTVTEETERVLNKLDKRAEEPKI